MQPPRLLAIIRKANYHGVELKVELIDTSEDQSHYAWWHEEAEALIKTFQKVSTSGELGTIDLRAVDWVDDGEDPICPCYWDRDIHYLAPR